MKISTLMVAAAFALVSATASDSAFGDRGRSARSSQFKHSGSFARSGKFVHKSPRFVHKRRVPVFIGVPIFAPWYDPIPIYRPPPSAPTVYIEQASEQEDTAQAPSYWYYCAESNAYYPYVSDCPGGWQQVAPQSPPP